MSTDIQKFKSEAAIYERYGNFKTLVMRLINQYLEDDDSNGSFGELAVNIYKPLQLGLSNLDTDGLAIRRKDIGSPWYFCFSMQSISKSKEIQEKINEIDDEFLSSSLNIDADRSINVEGIDVRIVVVRIGDDLVLLINPFKKKKYSTSAVSSVVAFPIAATFRELIKQYKRNTEKWTQDTSIIAWRAAQDSIIKRNNVCVDFKPHGRYNTITISLDLRKSTFAMEQAKENEEFVSWMKNLVVVLSDRSKDMGATFDKFTGDGVIIHFPLNAPWSKQECPDKMLVRALRCAAELVLIVEDLLPALRKNLHNDSGKFGAGVGMAMAEAQWAKDNYEHLMVVGRGVVGACRASDGAPAGRIRLVNSAYQPLCDVPNVKTGCFRRKTFETKEFGVDLDVPVWEIKAADVMAATTNCAP